MNVKKVSLREMMEDDNSVYMAELVEKFNKMYGDQLDRIIEESKKSGSAVSDRMGLNSHSARRSRAHRV